MLKRILLGTLLFFVVFALGVWLWISSMREPYPAVDSTVSAIDLPDSLPAALTSDLTSLIEAYRSKYNLPSISVAVGLDGELVYAVATGYADIEKEIAATPDSLYRVGSVSKPITAVAMARLAEQGLIDLDADFRDYVPDFPEKTWPFTLRQLASHQAGIRHYMSPLESYHDVHYDTVAEAMVLVEEDRLLFEPGTRYRYSSYGYNLLSAALAASAQQRFVELLEEQVYKPAGMLETLAENAPDPDPRAVGFYIQTSEDSYRALYADNSYKIAGGGLLSTPSDLVRFGQALLAGELVSQESWQTLTTPLPLADGSTDHGYGLGFGSGAIDTGDRQIAEIGHSGGSVGGTTEWQMFDDLETVHGTHDLVMALTMNVSTMGSEANIHELAQQLTERILESLDQGEAP